MPAESLTRTKTKIVATVGPACESPERLAELIDAGVDVFRLNMAHGRNDWREAVLARIRDASRQRERPVAILADLGGPKIRLGAIAGGSLQCEAGQLLRFVADPAAARAATDLTSTFPTLVSELQRGDQLLLADGTVALEVTEKTADAAECRVVQAGEIRTGGGINLPGVELHVPALTDKDRDDLRWAAGNDIDFFGLSFVRRAADVSDLRGELKRLGCTAQIVAKIEKPQAVAALDEIIAVSDAIMVARGDLGVEIDVARIAMVQKDIIRRANAARVPVITATQMLESMRSSRLPTRAEATDVANAILDGTDAVMLSAETAMGQYPIETVLMMGRIAREAERLLENGGAPSNRCTVSTPATGLLDDAAIATEALVAGASRIADQVAAKLIIVATTTGNTALALAKQRSHTPILGISDSDATARRLCLYWGVTPLVAPRFTDSGEFLRHVTAWSRARHLVASGDRVVLIASTHWTTTGHDMIVVQTVS